MFVAKRVNAPKTTTAARTTITTDASAVDAQRLRRRPRCAQMNEESGAHTVEIGAIGTNLNMPRSPGLTPITGTVHGRSPRIPSLANGGTRVRNELRQALHRQTLEPAAVSARDEQWPCLVDGHVVTLRRAGAEAVFLVSGIPRIRTLYRRITIHRYAHSS